MDRPELAMGVVLRTRWRAATLAAAALALGCSSPPPEQPVAVVQQRGVYGQYFLVSVAKPTGGRITSTDGQIDCGTGATKCGPAQYAWNATATFNAIPDPGNMFGTWASNCTCRGPCVLDTKKDGSDKYILAIFGPQGTVQHCNFTNQAAHGPAYLDFLGKQPNSFTCNDRSCHGPTLGGAGIAPACTPCHVSAGWTSWQTSCSFCHGRSSTETKPGYSVGDHPEWSAPPDAVAQRLTGTAAPVRTGAHQAHLTGVTSGGLGFAGQIPCATCHAVPADLAHVRGSSARANVVLTGAQASLPASLGAYDPSSGTCLTYCHGASPSPTWSSVGMQCGACHGLPPQGHLPFQGGEAACAVCHPATVRPDGTIDLAAGKHLDGVVEVDLSADGTACSTCHGTASTAGPPHLSVPPTLADCARCHASPGHPLPSDPAVSDAACVGCHADRG